MDTNLTFNFPEGKIVIPINCSEWYLSPEDDICNNNRQYLDEQWFYERLQNNLEDICLLAAIYDSECNFEQGNKLINAFSDEIDEFIGNGGMDTAIYAMEVFAQRAMKCNELHWW